MANPRLTLVFDVNETLLDLRELDALPAQQRGHHPRPLLARHADHAGRGGSPARWSAQRAFEGTNEGTADSAGTKTPRFTLRIGAAG